MSFVRRWGLPVWVLCLPVAALPSTAGRAADEPPPDSKAVDAVIHRALRDVINEGADMYNAQGRYQNGERDYAGCYHLYEGALMALRPLLSSHPDLQKAIGAGLDTARSTPRVEMRAFVLREVIDKIRDATGPGGKPMPPTTPVETKIEGRVTRAEGGKLTVKPATGEAMAFEIPDRASIFIDGKPGRVGDLKTDALVTITEVEGAVTRVDAKIAAAPPPPPPAETRVEGKVTKAEGGKLTVKPATGEAIDVTAPDSARVTVDGKPGKGADIKLDATVTLTLQDGKIMKIDAKNPAAPSPAAEKTFTGKVVRADKDGLLLRDDAGKDKPFAVSDAAKVTIDGKEGKLEDIKKDSTATVTSKGDDVIKVEAKSPTSPPPPPPPGKETLWDRLGGETGVAKVVDDFVNTAGKDPKVNFWRDPTFTPSKEQVAELKKRLVEFVSQASGGPLKYEGKSMKEAHKGMNITEAEFDAAAADLKAALEKNGVKGDDETAVLAAVEGTRKDIVQPKAPEDKPKPEAKPAEKGDVSGKVTYKGKPLPGGTVSLVAADGKIYSSPIKDGTYSVADVKPGDYKVAVETESVKPKSPDDKGGANYVAIPAKYTKPETSGLTITVMKGKQTKDFDLRD